MSRESANACLLCDGPLTKKELSKAICMECLNAVLHIRNRIVDQQERIQNNPVYSSVIHIRPGTLLRLEHLIKKNITYDELINKLIDNLQGKRKNKQN